MFCSNCGAQNSDDSVMCTSCGAPLETQEPEVTEAVPQVEATETETPKAPKAPKTPMDPSKRNKLIGICAVAAVAVVVLVVILAVVLGGGGGYKSLPQKYFNAMAESDSQAYVNLAPPKVVKEFQEEFDSKKEMLEIISENMEDNNEYIRERYGKHPKVKVEVLDDEKMSTRDLKDLKDRYDDNYDTKVTEAHTLYIYATISGDGESDKDTGTVRVVKIGGKWYMDVYSSIWTDYFYW